MTHEETQLPIFYFYLKGVLLYFVLMGGSIFAPWQQMIFFSVHILKKESKEKSPGCVNKRNRQPKDKMQCLSQIFYIFSFLWNDFMVIFKCQIKAKLAISERIISTFVYYTTLLHYYILHYIYIHSLVYFLFLFAWIDIVYSLN